MVIDNFSYNYDSSNIMSYQQDWVCPQCMYDNFGSNSKCRECGCFRSKSGGAFRSNTRPGDWMCPNCNINIFASKSSCFKCGASKNGNAAAKLPQVRPGDWMCPNCNDLIF